MTKCAAHPDQTAVAQCAGCHKAICEGCVAPGSDPALCYDCSINDAGKAVDRDAERSKQYVTDHSKKPARAAFAPGVKLVAVIGAIVIVLQVMLLVFLADSEATQRNHAGSGEPAMQATAVAIANTILVSEGLEQYRKEHGSYPGSLDALADVFPQELEFLLDKKTLNYKRNAGGFTLRQESEVPVPVVFDNKQGSALLEEAP